MGAIKYQKTKTSDKVWDGSEMKSNLKNGQDSDYYKKAYAWMDPEADPKTKKAYKFIHHEVDSEGTVGDANIKGCQTCIGVLNGAMGGADIPDGDRQGIYDHVSKHLTDADVEPGELKTRSKPAFLRNPRVAVRSFVMRDLATNDDNNITGHAAVFGQKTQIGSWFNEIIERGAFKNCDFKDVLFSTNHQLDKIPLARSRNNNANSTLQLTVDDIGLAVRANLDIENNVDAKALHSSIKRQDIDGMSFIFMVEDERWENMDAEYPDLPTRHVEKISKVYEVSAVNFPAYDDTDIAARDQLALDSAEKALESARSKLDSLHNEKRRKQLEIEKLRTQILMKG